MLLSERLKTVDEYRRDVWLRRLLAPATYRETKKVPYVWAADIFKDEINYGSEYSVINAFISSQPETISKEIFKVLGWSFNQAHDHTGNAAFNPIGHTGSFLSYRWRAREAANSVLMTSRSQVEESTIERFLSDEKNNDPSRWGYKWEPNRYLQIFQLKKLYRKVTTPFLQDSRLDYQGICLDTITALAARPKIGVNKTFTQKDYDTLTAPYRYFVGQVHPLDEELRHAFSA
jgi:hypothetical protein